MNFEPILYGPLFVRDAPDINLVASGADPVELTVATGGPSWPLPVTPVLTDGRYLAPLRMREILGSVVVIPGLADAGEREVPLVTLTAEGTSMSLRAVYGGAAGKTPTELAGHWLSWRDQVSKTYAWGRERLTFLAGRDLLGWRSGSYSVKAKVYLASGDPVTVTLVSGTLPEECRYVTVDASYAAIAALVSGTIRAWDVSYSFSGRDSGNANASLDGFPLRLVLARQDVRVKEFVFCNSFGVEDRVYSSGRSNPKLEGASVAFLNGAVEQELRNDATEGREVFSGYLGSARESALWLDFLKAHERHILLSGGLARIIVDTQDTDLQDNAIGSVKFTYHLGALDAGRHFDDLEGLGEYDPAQRYGALYVGDEPASEDLPTEDLFFLKTRLDEFPAADLDEDLLFLVQNPLTQAWGNASLNSIKEYLQQVITREDVRVWTGPWTDYSAGVAGYALSAGLGRDLYDRIRNIETHPTDLSNYYTKSQTDAVIQDSIAGKVDESSLKTLTLKVGTATIGQAYNPIGSANQTLTIAESDLTALLDDNYHPLYGEHDESAEKYFWIGGAKLVWHPAVGNTEGYLELQSALVTAGDQIVVSGNPGQGGGGGGAGYLYELNDVADALRSPSTGTMIFWNGSSWVGNTLPSGFGAGYVPQWDGSKWTAVAASSIGGVTSVVGQTGAVTAEQISSALSLGAAATYGIGSVASGNTGLVTGGAVWSAIDALPEPMVFKGSLGTGGTIKSLPVNGTAQVGDTYKVITAGTYAGQTAKVGDTFICQTKTASANTWVFIPSGDEPEGTVTSVGLSLPVGLVLDTVNGSASPITDSGTFVLAFQSGYAIPTTEDVAKGVAARGYFNSSGVLTYDHGGTGRSSAWTANSVIYASSTSALGQVTNVSGNSQKKFLVQTTNSSGVAQAPAWGSLAFSDLPTLYWANVAISNSSSTTTEPTFASVRIGDAEITWVEGVGGADGYLQISTALVTQGDQIVVSGTPGGGGGGGGGAGFVYELKDTLAGWTSNTGVSTGQVLMYQVGADSKNGTGTGAWKYGTLAISNISGLQSALDGKQASGNYVTSVKVGSTSYAPSSGVVSLPAYPTTLPASDVYAWAKAATKPSYTLDEVTDGSSRKLSDYLYGTANKNIIIRATDNSDTWGAIGYADGENTAFNFKVIRFGGSPGSSFGGTLSAYGSGIMFGGADTRAYMMVRYASGHVEFGGGSVASSTAAAIAPAWHFGINGTSGTTYDLPTIASNASNGNTAYNSLGNYVQKGGDTMTGLLLLKYDNPRLVFQASDGTVHGNIAMRSAGELEFYDLSEYRTVWHSGNLTKSVLTGLLEGNGGFYVKKSGDEMSGALTFAYNTGVYGKDSNENARLLLYLNTSNHLVIGNGLKDVASGGFAYLRGIELHLQTAARAGTYGDSVIVNSSGNVTIGSSDLAETSYKLYVNGAAKVTGQFYLGTSSVSSFNFVRGSANYFTAPADGYFAFVPNGLTSGISNSPLVITAGSIYPGAETDLGRSSSYWHYAYVNRVYLASGAYLEYNSTNGYIYISKPIVTEGDQIVISGTPGGGGGGGGSSYLYELLDVNLPATIPDGDFLSWDSTSSKWINKSIVYGVSSVAGKTGAVILTGDDISNLNTWIAGKGYITSYTDTKNTTGADNTTSKIFLVGPTAQTTSNGNARTYSNVNCYASGGKLYSNGKEVVNLSDTQALTNKTYNGYTLAAACAKAVVTTVDTSASLPTSGAVKTFVEGKGYVTSSGVTSITLTSGTGITVSDSGIAITSTGSRTISLNVAGAKTALGLGSMAYETASDYLTTTTAVNTYLTGTSNKNVTVRATDSSNTWGAVGFADGDNTKFNLYSIRFGATPGASYGGSLLAYGSGIMFGGLDTRAFIAVRYASGHVEFGGGSVSNPSATPNWHFGINGTSGTTYDLPTIASNASNGNTAYNSLGNYLLKTGGTISSGAVYSLYLNNSTANATSVGIRFQLNGTTVGSIYCTSTGELWNANDKKFYHTGNFLAGTDYVSISETERITGAKTFTGGLYLKFANPRLIFQAADGTVHGNIAARSAGVLEFYDLTDYRTVYHSGNSNGSSFPWACSTLTAYSTSGWTGTISSGNNIVYLAHANAGSGPLYLGTTGSASSGYLFRAYYGQTTLGSGGTCALSVRADGNVGIGTNSPTQKLHVEGNVYVNGFVRIANNNNINFWDANGNYSAQLVGFDSSNVNHFGYGGSGGVYQTRIYGNGITFYNNNRTQIATVENSGSWTISGHILPDANANDTAVTTRRNIGSTSRYYASISSNRIYMGENDPVLVLYGANISRYSMYCGLTATEGNGTHGAVTGNFAQYFTMYNSTNRGWIFQLNNGSSRVNVASISGGGVFTTAGDQVMSSDASLKTNFSKINYSVSDIASCRAVTFDWKDGRGRSAGSIAQDWKPLIPELVHGEEGNMTLAYGQIALVNTIILARHETEQDKEIKRLKARVEDLEKQLKIRS